MRGASFNQSANSTPNARHVADLLRPRLLLAIRYILEMMVGHAVEFSKHQCLVDLRSSAMRTEESPKKIMRLFLVRIRADVYPQLVDLSVREHVLPGRHLVPAVMHRGAELRAIVGCQSAQIRKLTRAH